MAGAQLPETRLATATAAKAGSTVTCMINDTLTTVQVARDLTVAIGDVLVCSRFGGQWIATARMFAAPPDVVDPGAAPPANPVSTSGVLVVSPVETRSYRNGGWRTDNTDVYQGQYGGGGNHTGAVFYGGAPRSLVGATVTAAGCQVRRLSGGFFAAQATTMRLMTQATRPGGAVTLGATWPGPSLPVNATQYGFPVPASWAQAMVDGTAGGLAFFVAGGEPYVRFAGIGDWSPAWTMTIYWTR